MSYTVRIDIDKSALEKMIAGFEGNLAEIGVRVGNELEGYAKAFSPIRTGLLRNSIHQEGAGGDILAQIAILGADCNYAIYQEFGTYKMAAHPFMTPAIEQLAHLYFSPGLWMPLLGG